VPHDAHVERLCRGAQLTLGRTVVHVLHPPCVTPDPNRTGDWHNDNAMVLLVVHPHGTVLICADAESVVSAYDHIGHIDVLRVAHHGSRDPGLPGLLQQSQPALAVISVGEGNSYGHPTPSTLGALARARVPVRRTDQDGTVVVESTPRGMVELGHGG
jgi:competence protein ComEC